MHYVHMHTCGAYICACMSACVSVYVSVFVYYSVYICMTHMKITVSLYVCITIRHMPITLCLYICHGMFMCTYITTSIYVSMCNCQCVCVCALGIYMHEHMHVACSAQRSPFLSIHRKQVSPCQSSRPSAARGEGGLITQAAAEKRKQQ